MARGVDSADHVGGVPKMDPITGFLAMLHFDQIAYAGIVTYIIFRILTGRLVPRKSLEDWRTAYMESELANRELLRQNGLLIDASKTTTKVVASLPEVHQGGPS